jgi:hypothetical protein
VSIDVAGQISGAERDAAESLKARLEPLVRPHDRITIVAGAKCYGQKNEDIDLLVIGQFAADFHVPHNALPAPLYDNEVHLSNFLLVIEVKDQDGAHVRFEGNQVRVRYTRGWKDASAQVFNQVFSVKAFIEQQMGAGPAPHIFKAIWLRNVPWLSLPANSAQILAADATGADVLRTILEQKPEQAKREPDGKITVSSTSPEGMHRLQSIAEYFTRRIEPGTLDRKRLDIVSRKHLKGQQYIDRLGAQALIFRGRGGAGKTLRLLSIGNQMREERKARVLLLTYNLALVADIKRLLAIMGGGDDIDAGSIHVRSRDSFLMGLIKACGFPPRNHRDPLSDFETRKQMFENATRQKCASDIRDLGDAPNHPEVFAWDFVLVDEGQDWPEIDRDILLKVFGAEKLIIADGVDQFVHSQPKRCAWDIAEPRQIVTLHRSLRLKANLCRFAASFAAETGVEWDMEPNDDVGGGHVKIVLGPYDERLHRQIMWRHTAEKNNPIDALFCVTGGREAQYSNLPSRLQRIGSKVWDGTQHSERQDYPRDLNQHRVVKYESCRGLEGWTVVCLDLDVFFQRKIREGLELKSDDLFSPAEDVALRHAARWCLIPFTRAVDTLVIQLSPQSPLWQRLSPVARRHEDFVDVISG